jgi:hypothetical protein
MIARDAKANRTDDPTGDEEFGIMAVPQALPA